MINSTDGKSYIYALEITDSECGTLHSLHNSEESAIKELERIKSIPDLFGPLGLYDKHAQGEISMREIQS